MVVSLLAPCLLICIPAIVAYRAERQLGEAFHWVSHTLEVQRQLQVVLSSLLEAEAGQRGFLLTSREDYLEHYQASLEQLPKHVAQVRDLTSDNRVQQEHLRQLDPLIATKLDFMSQAVSLQRHGSREDALALINTNRGRQTMDAIRARLKSMEQEEARLLVTREQALAGRARFSTALLCALVALDFLFAVAVFILFRRLARMQSLVTVCAWSRTVEYRGEWLSFEEYLLRRFNLNTSHGISPAEAQKVFGEHQPKPHDAKADA